jgi:hypothetical protein
MQWLSNLPPGVTVRYFCPPVLKHVGSELPKIVVFDLVEQVKFVFITTCLAEVSAENLQLPGIQGHQTWGIEERLLTVAKQRSPAPDSPHNGDCGYENPQHASTHADRNRVSSGYCPACGDSHSDL